MARDNVYPSVQLALWIDGRTVYMHPPIATASTIERFKTCTHTGRFCSFSVKPGDYRMYPSLDSDRMQFVRGRWRGEGGGIVPWDHDRSVEISRPIMILKGERR